MKYDKTKKLSGVPAAFFLTPAGLRIVQKKFPYFTDTIIRNSYSDKTASDALIRGSYEIFELANSLMRTYPSMNALTARQLADLEYFPQPLPSLYIANQKDNQSTTRYFVYHFRDIKRYDIAVKSGIQKLVAYRESDNYSASSNEFPCILIVCETVAIKRLVLRTMRNFLNKSYESMLVYTTIRQTLTTQVSRDQLIWSNINDCDTVVSLDTIESYICTTDQL